MFHIPSLKAGMKEAGFVVTEGENMTAKDMAAFYDYAHRFFGLDKAKAAYGLAYPSTVTSAIPGHPANPNTPKEALLAPVVFPPPSNTPDDSEDDQLARTQYGKVPGELVETPGEVSGNAAE
jgi:hypothetical protein